MNNQLLLAAPHIAGLLPAVCPPRAAPRKRLLAVGREMGHVPPDYWVVVGRSNLWALALADRHYSRGKPGTNQMCAPGHNIVLLGADKKALWVSHRSAPDANLERPRFDGFDCWDNTYFRNESAFKSSELIRLAIDITLSYWGDILPADGFHSFVDPANVKPRKRPGECFLWSGFKLWPAPTEKGLLRFVMSIDKLRARNVLPARLVQLSLFAADTEGDQPTAAAGASTCGC